MLGMDQPLPPHGGTRLRLLHLARQAATVHDVKMLAVGEAPPHTEEPFVLEGVGWGRSRLSALARSATKPYLFHRLNSTGMADAVARHPTDLIQISSIYFDRAAARAAPAPVILDAHNVETQIVRTQARSDRSALQRARWRWEAVTTNRYERRVLGGVDAVLACSDDDAAFFERLTRRVVIVPNGVDLAATPFGPPAATPTVVYLGLYSYRPNEVAALRLTDDVMSRVWTRLPDATLRLVGADPTPAMVERAGPRVEVTGRVDDAVAELARSRVLVIALTAGSGTRLKAIEAMASGTVVVSTTTGVAGLGVANGEHVLIADTDHDLAEATQRVLTDDALATRLASNARRLVEQRFDWSRCAAPMLALHDDLLTGSAR